MNYSVAIDHAVELLEREADRLREVVGDGIQDFDEYNRKVGEIRGIKLAIRELLDLEKKLDHS